MGRWWTCLWKLDISLKIKIFNWKTYHEWIPTRANLSRRGIQIDSMCSFCHHLTKTTIHALWGCRILKYVRLEWLPRNKVPNGNNEKFFDFIYDCFHLLCCKDLELLYVTIWKVWCMRNFFLYERKRHDVLEAISWGKDFLGQFQRRDSTTTDKIVRPSLNVAHWKPPDQGSYKINCKVIIDDRGGWIEIGIFIRNALGLVMASCSLRFAAGVDVWAANSLAILKSFQFGSECGLFPFDIESEAKRSGTNVVWVPTVVGLAKEALSLDEDQFWMEDFPLSVRREV
ncbi:hypothetical protein Dsin_002062 [Dipteronia sinensis]|uniref:Reverse transcriptase zinc-binding domain-containing protein n=1 Tax=Dipteronia sinensis TaxID=43782 RepID=A0AAE0EJ14_9ROSI|nr:hypothetical protein Dsin_002062 [Dipteronia sinensis]